MLYPDPYPDPDFFCMFYHVANPPSPSPAASFLVEILTVFAGRYIYLHHTGDIAPCNPFQANLGRKSTCLPTPFFSSKPISIFDYSVFALLDPDFESVSGSSDLIESGSETQFIFSLL